jgi:hypothetical protein
MAKRRRRRKLKRRDFQRAAVLLAVVLVVGAIALFVNLYNSTSPTPPPVAGIGPGGGAGLGGPGTAAPSAASSTPASSAASTPSLLHDFPAQLTTQIGHNYAGMPGHKIVLTVSAAGSIARLGYLVPSADSNQEGDLHSVSGGWSQTFIARGPYGPYSAIFIQTNQAGTAVHCTVSVDGVQKDSQTVSGRYKQGLCYG